MKKVYLLLFFLIFTTSIFSQKIIVNGKESNGILKWEDFTGITDENSNYAFWISYNYFIEDVKIKQLNAEELIVENIKTKVVLDPTSWAKDDLVSNHLLKDAQNRFNFVILNAKRIREEVTNKKMNVVNYHMEIERTIKKVNEKNKAEFDLYIEETKDYGNKVAREKWDNYFREKLPEIYN